MRCHSQKQVQNVCGFSLGAYVPFLACLLWRKPAAIVWLALWKGNRVTTIRSSLVSNQQGNETNSCRETHPVSNLTSDLQVDVPPPKLQRKPKPKLTSWLQSPLGLDSQKLWDNKHLPSQVITFLRWFVKQLYTINISEMFSMSESWRTISHVLPQNLWELTSVIHVLTSLLDSSGASWVWALFIYRKKSKVRSSAYKALSWQLQKQHNSNRKEKWEHKETREGRSLAGVMRGGEDREGVMRECGLSIHCYWKKLFMKLITMYKYYIQIRYHARAKRQKHNQK